MTRKLQFKEYDERVKHFIRNIGFLNTLSPIPKTRKALNLLLAEMSSEKGFTRHDGRDYFAHPIAVAQTAIDFGLVNNRIRVRRNYRRINKKYTNKKGGETEQ